MNNETVHNAIEHNGDIIIITLLVSIDIAVSMWLIDISITPTPSIITDTAIGEIDTQTLRGYIMIKSVFLYIVAFTVAQKLP